MLCSEEVHLGAEAQVLAVAQGGCDLGVQLCTELLQLHIRNRERRINPCPTHTGASFGVIITLKLD